MKDPFYIKLFWKVYQWGHTTSLQIECQIHGVLSNPFKYYHLPSEAENDFLFTF